MKLVFLGSDEIALPCLQALRASEAGYDICGVITQPDRRSGRGRLLHSNPIKKWAMEHGIPVREPVNPAEPEIAWIKGLGADLALVMAYGHILSNGILDATPCGCFNLHASLLPEYRGASPIETSLAAGDNQTGVTLMRVIQRMDAGPLIDSETVPILASDTGASLRKKIGLACVPLLMRSMPVLSVGDFPQTKQNESLASYCRKLTKEDGRLDFSLSAHEIECRSRAFSTWPGTWFPYHDENLKVGGLSVFQGEFDLLPGQRYAEKTDSLVLGTGKGLIEIMELQKPGGRMVPVSDFLRGYPLPEHVSFPVPIGTLPLVR